MKGRRRHRAMHGLLDTIFPPRCVACRARSHWLCPACLRRIDYTPDALCGVCGRPLDKAFPHGCRGGSLATLQAVGAFAGPLQAAIYALKYQGRHGVAAVLATLLAPTIASYVHEGDLLVAVPLHPMRERERGYNQAAILASELRYLLPLEFAPSALVRLRATADQTRLSAAERDRNVRGAFAATDAVQDRRTWLLDDVYTTGATMRSAAHALRAAGAREVHGIAVARTT